ncbi:MAG: cytochrome-c peroxidase [Nitrosomonadales bacterium]|nr:cytochrome-c peroxidase [Nitrosomonadales bacterium]
MVKKSGRVVLALSGLTLCVAAFLFLFPVADHHELPDSVGQEDEHSDGQEPITPIPLEVKLDARKVALGRRLFFDPKLSHDNTVSCSSCHDLAKGGVDGLPFPVGVGRREGKINTLTVFNSSFNFRLFWDGRAASLEEQMDFQLKHPDEMASTWDEVTAKLGNDASYRRDFSSIYPDGIQISTVKDAVSTFERSLITPNARFDRFLRGDKQALDQDELAGYGLFKNLGCISCHQGRNVGGNMYEKLGIVGDYFIQRGNVQEIDYGRYNITKIEEQRHDFRVPSLRNVALTAPYFHDASASTLEQAVAIMGKYQLGVDLSGEEVRKIVKFLNTLTGVYQSEAGK